jgi:hypothetical protein
MRRREFIALMGASVAWPFAALAQEPGRTYRLGVLAPPPRDDDVVTAFFDGVRRQGFIEGQNLTVIYHSFAFLFRHGREHGRSSKNRLPMSFGNPSTLYLAKSVHTGEV